MTATVALITGANKGIGFETARKLAREGSIVLVGARDEGRGNSATQALLDEGADARFVHLDVTDDESVKKAADWIERTFGHLDILVNNAGILIDQGIAVPEVTAGQLLETYQTNVFGAAAVTSALIPLLRRSPHPRVVNLSSSLGSLSVSSGQPDRVAPYQMLAYNTSKAALNALTIMYANALRADGVKVNAAEPGFVATDLNGHAGTGTAEQGAEIVVRLALLDDTGPTATFESATGPIPW